MSIENRNQLVCCEDLSDAVNSVIGNINKECVLVILDFVECSYFESLLVNDHKHDYQLVDVDLLFNGGHLTEVREGVRVAS